MPVDPLSDRKPDCVVVDTSIWRADPLLRGPTGVSLVYTLSRQGGKIGLPEVVESELIKQIVEVGREASREMGKGARILSLLSNTHHFAVTPDDATLRSYVDARLKELAPLLYREAFTLEHAKAALEMVNAQVAPNGRKNQQFKDSAIWRASLSIASQFTTHLVTGDKAFFADRDQPKNGLAQNLMRDCREAGVQIQLHPDIASCLKAIVADQPVIDTKRVSELVQSAVFDQLKEQAEKNRYEITEVLDTKITPLRTENPNRIAIDYTLIAGLAENPSFRTTPRESARGIVHGSAYFLSDTANLDEHLVQKIALRHKNGAYIRSFKDYDTAVMFPRPIDTELD